MQTRCAINFPVGLSFVHAAEDFEVSSIFPCAIGAEYEVADSALC